MFTCNLDLELYPFDVQDCAMRFRITSASKSFLEINLTSSSVINFANELLVEYAVSKMLPVNSPLPPPHTCMHH